MTTTEAIRYESLVPPRNEVERELVDPELWDWTSSEQGESVPDAAAILEVRFERDEFLALARLAGEEGIGPAELMRRTMRERITASRIRERRH